MKRVSTFSNRLAELRRMKGWTLEEMGKAIQMNPQTLNRYELGQRVPKVTDANEIADSLNVNPLWLQGYDIDIDDNSSVSGQGEIVDWTPPANITAAAAHLDTNDPEAIEEYNKLIEYFNFKYGNQAKKE